MPMPSVMISDLWEPHADLSLLQFGSRHRIRPNSHLRRKTPTEAPFTFSPVDNSSPPRSQIGTKTPPQPQFGTTLSLLLLYQQFTALFPHPLSSFSSTSVLPFSRNVLLPCGYVSTIGLVAACGLHSSRIVRRVCPERWFILGDPARSDDEKTPNRKFPQTAVFTYGAPRQPPLQDYAVDAHPSFRP
jgi:hypothetical protein